MDHVDRTLAAVLAEWVDTQVRRLAAAASPIRHAPLPARRPRLAALRDRALALGLLQLFTVFGAACLSMQLMFDPRYRDFAVPLYLIPAVGFVWLNWLQRRAEGGGAMDLATALERPEERWLAVLGFASVLVMAVKEGPFNVESIGWTIVALLVFMPWLRLAWAVYRDQRKATKA